MREQIVRMAKPIMERNDIVHDAREHARTGDSLAGAILWLDHGVPRWYAERAVAIAVDRLDGKIPEPETPSADTRRLLERCLTEPLEPLAPYSGDEDEELW